MNASGPSIAMRMEQPDTLPVPRVDAVARRTALEAFVASEILPCVDAWERDRVAPIHLSSALARVGISGPGTTAPTISERIVLARALGECGALGVALTCLRAVASSVAPGRLYGEAGGHARHGNAVSHEFAVVPDSLIGMSLAGVASDGPTDASVCFAADGDAVILTGEAMAVAPGAGQRVALLAHSESCMNSRNSVLALIALDAPGVSVERCAMLGLRTATVARLRIDRCRVAGTWLAAPAPRAVLLARELWAAEQLVNCAVLLGALRRALRETITWTGERRFVNRRLADLQVIRHRVADLTADYEIAAALVVETGSSWELGGGDRVTRAAMSTIVCHGAARRVVEGCLQLFGGRGFMADNWVTRLYRDIITLGSIGSPAMVATAVAAEGLAHPARPASQSGQ